MMERLALAFALFALAVPLGADEPTTKVRVEVTNHKDRPVERASVILKFDDGRSIKKFGKKVIRQWEAKTNQEGFVSFPTLPQGKVLLMVIADRYQTFAGEVDVAEEEKTFQIKLNPPQPQYSAH